MKYTPMVEQYLEIKKNYQDCFLFYRLGDFYEMFFNDAIDASKILQITLTSRDAGNKNKIPMCGVPYHSANSYIDILINKGYKIAICEQVSPPGAGKIVERKVIQVITPGTYMDYKNLNENNYIGLIYYEYQKYYLICIDIMTADVKAIILKSLTSLLDEINKNNIKELININIKGINFIDKYVTNKEIEKNLKYENTENIKDEVIKTLINNLYNYVEKTQSIGVENFKNVKIYNKNEYLYMTSYSLKNLEVIQNINTNSKKGSLLSVIDKTKTSHGSRKLKQWIENPLIDICKIKNRQEIVSIFLDEFFIRYELQKKLNDICDIERLSSKISYGLITPKELINLKNSLKKIPEIKNNLKIINKKEINMLNEKIILPEELLLLLDNAIDDKAGQVLKNGNIIKYGYNEELDKYKDAKKNADIMLLNVEKEQKEKTGIKNLKIGFNKVFGYYVEISKTSLKNVNIENFGYIRKQTLSNCERYIFEDLKKLEEYIINSNQKIEELETNIFNNVKEKVKKYVKKIQILSNFISELDVYISLSSVAEEYGYTKPTFNYDKKLDISEARHPIVERMIENNVYIKNDFKMQSDDNILLITGPNMSGKSTYMRQLALIVILAQMGSYVPCSKANLPIFDKIFTRIGASDDLAGGKSTFMVEMIEAKNALVESTENSLLIFDEIGRGTSTYDGIALARAILEYINTKIKCKTLFSTHYHELTKLGKNNGIKNIHVTAKEENGELIFLYKVAKGAIEKSYGIHVAKLANIPDEIISNANKILKKLENDSKKFNYNKKSELGMCQNNSSQDKYRNLAKKLQSVDIMNTTPLQAIKIIDELKKSL